MNRSGHVTPVVATVILLYVGVTMPLTRVVAGLERRVRSRARA
jgi:ABC-type amino acid transport system permease subunit